MADLGSEDRFGRARSHRIERSERRIAQRYIEATTTSSKDREFRSSRTSYTDQDEAANSSGVANELSSVDREAARKERRAERRRMREERDKEPERESTSAQDEPVEAAAVSPEPQQEPKKSLKKERKSENVAKKRQAKKNLREKRRSTGVVIMPNEKESTDDEEERAVKENTMINTNVGDDEVSLEVQVDQLSLEDSRQEEPHTSSSRTRRKKDREHKEYRSSGSDYESMDKAVLIQRLEECQDSLDKANKEIERLREENQRLNNEHSALLRVVTQLSAKK